MQEVLPQLLARGVSGRAREPELRVLDFLACQRVNRRLFGQPLAGSVGYYLADYLGLVFASERFHRRAAAEEVRAEREES